MTEDKQSGQTTPEELAKDALYGFYGGDIKRVSIEFDDGSAGIISADVMRLIRHKSECYADLLAALQSSLQFVIAWLPEYESGSQRDRIEAQIAKTQAAIARAEGKIDAGT